MSLTTANYMRGTIRHLRQRHAEAKLRALNSSLFTIPSESTGTRVVLH
jgi:hypothetical protein